MYDTVSLIASALAGAGGTFAGGLKNAFSALATAIDGSGISHDKTGVSALISSIAQSEHLVLGQGVADAIASVIIAGNTALDHVVQTDQSGAQFLSDTASIELVMQGAASTAIQQAANNTARVQSVLTTFTGPNLNGLITAALNQLGPDNDTGEQSAFRLTVNGDSSKPIGASSAGNMPFTIAGIDLEDSGAVTFADANGKTVRVEVNGGQTGYSADLSALADGSISSSLSVNTDPAGNSFTPVAGNAVELDQDAGEQAALSLTLGITDIGRKAADAVPFTIGGLEARDTGSVIFTDANRKSLTVGVNGSKTSYSADLSTLADGPIKSSLVVNTDEAGNSFKPVSGNTVTLDTDKDREPPVLTISDHSLSLSAGGMVPLPISVSTSDADDTVTVKISGVPRFDTITAGDGDAVAKKGDSYTFTVADVQSGLTLHSSFEPEDHSDHDGREHDRDEGENAAEQSKLTVTAVNTTHGEYAATSPQTIAVTNTPPTYTFTTLTNGPDPTAINASGQVVGSAENGTGFLYSHGKYTTIDDPLGVRTEATDINNSGKIVGTYTDKTGTLAISPSVQHGFLYSHGKYTTIDGPLGTKGTEGNLYINASGKIAGTYIDSSGGQEGFLYSHGKYTTIETH